MYISAEIMQRERRIKREEKSVKQQKKMNIYGRVRTAIY